MFLLYVVKQFNVAVDNCSDCCGADVLSDPQSRALYDEYGPEGMLRMNGASAGRGNARQVLSRNELEHA